MRAALAAWISGNRDVYFGNATAMRDFRVQLRGSRSVVLFGAYLGLLILVALFAYSGTAGGVGSSIVDAQRHLQEFYNVTMDMLGLAVCVIAPALTATSIVQERQRQSIDLVFSAPVSPKYYLVGKMISSFRYTWMLLVLALPITAAAVVLGGASWSDVIIAYILLSFQGLILTALALLMSTLSAKPVGAIIWSYAISIAYNVAAYGLVRPVIETRFFGRPTNEQPFTVALSPFATSQAAKTYSVIGGHHFPNWIIAAVVSVLIAKICLLGAGALLNPTSSKEIAGLRLHGLIYTIVGAFAAGSALWPAFAPGRAFVDPDAAIAISPSASVGILACWLSTPLILFVPFIACYGFDRERRLRPNGVFKLKRIFDGTPGGGLPFLLLTLVAMFAAFAIGGAQNSGIPLDRYYWEFVFFIFSFWILMWAVGRLGSSLFNSVKTSRALVFIVFLAISALPFPLLVALAGTDPPRGQFSLWDLYVLSPMSGRHTGAEYRAVLYGVVLLAFALVFTLIAESKTRRVLSTIRDYDERPYQAA